MHPHQLTMHCRLLDRTQTVRQKAVVCVCALATAAPMATNCNDSTIEAVHLFGQTIASHAERLLLAKDHLQNEVHCLTLRLLHTKALGALLRPIATSKGSKSPSRNCVKRGASVSQKFSPRAALLSVAMCAHRSDFTASSLENSNHEATALQGALEVLTHGLDLERGGSGCCEGQGRRLRRLLLTLKGSGLAALVAWLLPHRRRDAPVAFSRWQQTVAPCDQQQVLACTDVPALQRISCVH